MRDDFLIPVKDLLAKRVGFRCSNPACRKPTSGPQEDPTKSVNIGVAAHITAASPDGARYNTALSSEERKLAENGIWLCQDCAKLVDNDENRYTVEVLQHWKAVSESAALRSLESRSESEDNELLFLRLEQLMPDLMEEIRKDLTAHPLRRLFVPLSKKWVYWAGGDELVYYYEDHPELDNKLRILLNHGLIRDITKNTNAKHYVFTEAFVRYFGV
ncbi:MAG: hypothetical protein WCD47_12075 [Candidatus Sulfotelmatobacter sp.]